MDEAKPDLAAALTPQRDARPEVVQLWTNLKAALPELEKELTEANDHWVYEDGIYRLFHGSFKVFYLQSTTKAIVERLQALMPGRPLNKSFMKIVGEGTGKEFEFSMNKRWLEETRPIVEAFFYAKFFLEMAVKYAKEMEGPETLLPSGWAAFLYLYDLR